MPRICFTLAFDAATQQAVQELWGRLAHAGIPQPDQSRYRPHVTLAVYDVENIDEYETILAPVASALAPFPIRLESLGIFPERGVIFLAPRMSHTLFFLHRATFQALESMDEMKRLSPVSDWLRPDQWVPHTTLAVQLTPPQILKGLETCLLHWTPLQGRAIGIGMRIVPEPADCRFYPFESETRP